MDGQRSHPPYVDTNNGENRHLLDDRISGIKFSDATSTIEDIQKGLQSEAPSSSRWYGSARRFSLRSFQFPSPILFLSTLWVITAASGIATALIVWIVLHITQPSLREIWKEGAFLLDEGTHSNGGFPASSLMVLVIASASSLVMGTVTPVLLSIYAYRSAHLWLRAGPGSADIPTPLQYGLTIESLGGAGIFSLSSSGNYLLRPSKRSPPAPYMLKEAFCVSVLAYVTAHAVGAVDIWIHTTAETVAKEVEVNRPEPIPIGITQTLCVSDPYPPTVEQSPGRLIPPCNLPDDPEDVRHQALEILANLSSVVVAFPANGSGIAALITRNTGIPDNSVFQITTFGARATCAPFNSFCTPLVYFAPELGYVFRACNGSPSNFPWTLTEEEFTSTSAGMFPIISFPSNAASDHMIQLFSDLIGYPGNITQPKPYNLWLQIWSSIGELYSSRTSTNIFSVIENRLFGAALVTCNVSYYNVTLEYRSGIYTAIDEVLTARFLSDGLSGALRVGFYNDILLDELKSTFCSDSVTDEERMELLTQEITKMATASAGIIANVTAPPHKQFKVQTLGRYPIYPVISLITLLYVNSAFALVICIMAANSCASKTKIPGTMQDVSLLDLVRRRLTSPFALIEDMCRLLDPNREKGSVEAIYEDTSNDKIDKRRIRVGLQEDEVGKAVFRIWIERDDEVLTKDCDSL